MKNKLKRFVLTSHNTIYEVVDKKVLPIGLRDNYIKTSDNILDLVEVGDLVEILYTGNDKYYKLEVIRYDENTLETTHMTMATKSFKGFTYSKDNLNLKLPFCIAIYKKQPNGDYKKYEVKK